MVITLNIKNDEVMEKVVKAILNEAYAWEEKRQYFEEKYNETAKNDGCIREKRLEYYARREEECKKMSDELWNIKEKIKNGVEV